MERDERRVHGEAVLAQKPEGPAKVGGGVAFGQAPQYLVVERLDRGRDEEATRVGQGGAVARIAKQVLHLDGHVVTYVGVPAVHDQLTRFPRDHRFV